MTRQLFGTDGMRGRANEGAMSAEVALNLVERSAICYTKEASPAVGPGLK